MLQIATGRFFTKPDLVREYAGTGVLYSNFAWPTEIVTEVGTLVPADWLGAGPRPWILHYTNRMESERRAGAIARVGDAEIVEQFQVLCILGLRAFFHVERDVVSHGCRARASGRHDRSPPSVFVARLLDPQVMGTDAEVARFKTFIHDAVRLPRARYNALIACARAVCDSLIVASYNLHAAYSMLVYALDSLCQEFDGHEAAWIHFDEAARAQLDEVLESVPPEAAAAVRDILTNSTHAKLTARFVQFVQAHVRDAFFLTECPPSLNSISRTDLPRALRTTYEARSGFVHRLERLREQICVPVIASEESLEWERRPYLTYRGLLRLVQHVLHTFISQGPFLESEAYPWKDELPGIIRAYAAPQYWIWQADDFSPAAAVNVLSGLLSHLNQVISEKTEIADMRKVVARCMELLPQGKLHEKRAMLLIVILFNHTVRDADCVPGWSEFADNYMSVLDGGCIEALLLDLYLGRESDPPVADCASIIDGYLARQHHKAVPAIPKIQQTALMLSIYNRMLAEGMQDDAASWARRATLDEAGAPLVQARIAEAVAKREPIDLKKLMWERSTLTSP